MTEYGLQPSYIRLDYHSAYGPHSQTLPTKQWLPTSITGAMGSYVDWTGTPIDAEDMIDDFVALEKTLLPPSSSFDGATIFNYDSGIAKFLPVAYKSLAVAGSSGTGSPNKAVSMTLNLRTLGGQPAKLVYLDVVHTGAEFNKETFLTWTTPMVNVFTEYISTAKAWSGRDNTRVDGAVSLTWDLNDALRKQYRMI